MNIREYYIRTLNEIQTDIDAIKQKLQPLGNGWQGEVAAAKERLKQVRIKKLCVESQIATNLPIEIEGFLGDDVSEEVERDEHGTIREVYYYLGCPNLARSIYQPNILYNKFKDLTEILQHNTGKFLRVTIEAIPIGESENCTKCDKRFQCLTTKVKG